jgi:hypothetical protein
LAGRKRRQGAGTVAFGYQSGGVVRFALDVNDPELSVLEQRAYWRQATFQSSGQKSGRAENLLARPDFPKNGGLEEEAVSERRG